MAPGASSTSTPLGRPEFQAVILASGNDGDNLYPLTENAPPAILPVANRPLLSFQLELLERSQSFREALVLVTEAHRPALEHWRDEFYKGALQVELIVVPDGCGSADALRHIRAKLLSDFVLLAGDVITDVPFQRMADLHRLQGSAATVLFRESAPREAGVAKKAKELDGIDFVGLDAKRQRLLSLVAAADCDGGVVAVSQSMLRAYPHVVMHTDLVDAHCYIFAHWVLDVLELKPHFSSAKFELLPYLVRKQFLDKANLSVPAPGNGGHSDTLAMCHGTAARKQLTGGADFRCSCFILAHDAGYCVRANTIPNYMQANLDISRGGVTTFEKPAEEPEPPPKEGNFVLRSFSADCTRGASCEVGARSSIKKSCVGRYCKIGSGAKLTNCILMDHVVIGDKVTMSNVVVCANAEVREGASLKDAQVAQGVTVEAGAKVNGDAVTERTSAMDDDSD